MTSCIFVVVTLVVISISHAASLWAVKAGTVSNGNIMNIGKLENRKANTVKVCPEKYPNGFSIECRGNDVNPQDGVKFYVNNERSQTEWVSPPYMIAGDKDRPPAGLTEIGAWTDWMEETRCV